MSILECGRRELLVGAAAVAATAAVAGTATTAMADAAGLPIVGYAVVENPIVWAEGFEPPAPNQPEVDSRAMPNEELIAKYFPAPSGALEGKIALVTGASSGFGREIARAFAREGAKVVAVARREARLEALSLESANYPGEIAGFVADLSDRSQVRQAVEFAKELYGRIDILVNNAGYIGGYETAGSIVEGLWDYCHALNYEAPLFAMRAVINEMVEQGDGVIINMSSVGGTRGYFGVEYHCTKAALNALTKETAFMFSTTGVRCNAILPGGFDTEINIDMRPGILDEAALAKTGENGAAYVTYGNQEEIAALALWLTTPAAKNINGALVASDGGWTC